MSVHPRVCGEQSSQRNLSGARTGSSPRVRGTAPPCRPSAARNRFIPACAGNSQGRHYATSRASVHPRVCGEQERCAKRAGLDNGSSPRVRGTAHAGGPGHTQGRFIPACAGNRPKWHTCSHPHSVHPRVCGEQLLTNEEIADIAGSSPRVRGTGHRALHSRHVDRFIPACAGNSIVAPVFATSPAVHPRVCGEQGIRPNRWVRIAGSSPRVRGTESELYHRGLQRRFIPACAGNRTGGEGSISRNTVHPRVCGEQFRRVIVTLLSVGSSPRVRGTVERKVNSGVIQRFIPACAGNSAPARPAGIKESGSSPRVRGTVRLGIVMVLKVRFIPACAGNRFRPATVPAAKSVHPRVCGEQFPGLEVDGLLDGSSPRVRGTDHEHDDDLQLDRFIPACAGNRPSSWEYRRSSAVHPRVCGEQLSALRHTSEGGGSSPRVRGTGYLEEIVVKILRFIPACAGNRTFPILG